jgi:hypothetical protein
MLSDRVKVVHVIYMLIWMCSVSLVKTKIGSAYHPKSLEINLKSSSTHNISPSCTFEHITGEHGSDDEGIVVVNGYIIILGTHRSEMNYKYGK